MTSPILRIAIPSPLRRLFDYLPPKGAEDGNPLPGARVRVPFGRTMRVGLIIEVADTSDVAPEKLKRALAILDREPLLPPDNLALLRWASSYYHHPLGDAALGVLPALLKDARPAEAPGPRRWRLTAAGREPADAALARAPRQAALREWLRAHPDGIAEREIKSQHHNALTSLRALEKKELVASFSSPCWEAEQEAPREAPPPQPEPAQQTAMEAILAASGQFQPFLLDGVTSSGKTEVYLVVIQAIVSRGGQALVLIPEIGLTPQTVARFRRRIAAPVVALHSGLSDSERLCGWLAARSGEASVIIGTRSAAFVPLKRPGVFIVDEEHDLSYKQQDHFRYSARDVAVYRAKKAGVPVVLGSATPSLESLYNTEQDRYRRLTLPERVQGARHPAYRVTDVRGRPFRNGLSDELLAAIGERLTRREQVLLFLNRRGYAPIQLCHACGWVAGCERCDARMVYHAPGGMNNEEPRLARRHLRCHHCGSERPAPERCPQCGSEAISALWAGTQRIAQALAEHFPDANIARVDRDTTGAKGALEKILHRVEAGTIDVLVGTQMLAKGHHFPNVTLVGIVDADGGLFGADFRAGERMAQTIVQVAGRAGRGDRPGEVLIQTHHPEHPLLQALIRHGYHRFAEIALAERREAGLPPFHHLALARAEAPSREAGMAFLGEVRALAETLLAQSPAGAESVYVLGPAPAPMERREARYRAQLLLDGAGRGALHGLLSRLIPQVEALPSAKRVRWSLDVDPGEMV
uniref:Replication restart protein PriA n=1 Tax=Candidatus Kentrum sp. DK TaxID=2126562 RepID=A0A450TF63_9GAMM|nr:MAG: replication restart DNA helicase PriA [Candidatus Kentron sp. DK]VFJ65719.1 MAG: replication restart DNA helicase PriA [Candidatus Kentron sp. DK]